MTVPDRVPRNWWTFLGFNYTFESQERPGQTRDILCVWLELIRFIWGQDKQTIRLDEHDMQIGLVGWPDL
jgi:hypothetical protein